MSTTPTLNLGAWRYLDSRPGSPSFLLPARDLVTHGVVVGMTGSGKTGLLTVLVEEALSNGIPAIVIDVKGDLANLLLAITDPSPAALAPWLGGDGDDPAAAGQAAEERRAALAEWSIGEPELRRFARSTVVRVFTPGATAGEPVHVLSTLERRSPRWDTDPETARDALSAAVFRVRWRDAPFQHDILVGMLPLRPAEHRATGPYARSGPSGRHGDWSLPERLPRRMACSEVRWRR